MSSGSSPEVGVTKQRSLMVKFKAHDLRSPGSIPGVASYFDGHVVTTVNTFALQAENTSSNLVGSITSHRGRLD